MKAERLEAEFAPRAVSRARGSLLLRPTDAVELVSRAAEEGVPIVRVNAADTSAGDGAELERLADFSRAVAEGHGCWDVAEAVIRAKHEREIAFQLTLGDDPIEAV